MFLLSCLIKKNNIPALTVFLFPGACHRDRPQVARKPQLSRTSLAVAHPQQYPFLCGRFWEISHELLEPEGQRLSHLHPHLAFIHAANKRQGELFAQLLLCSPRAPLGRTLCYEEAGSYEEDRRQEIHSPAHRRWKPVSPRAAFTALSHYPDRGVACRFHQNFRGLVRCPARHQLVAVPLIV